MKRLLAISGSSMWAPCACCGFEDTEVRLGPCESLDEGERVTCEACLATLTVVQTDYCTDEGASWGWEATAPASLVAAITVVVQQVPRVLAGREGI